VQISIGKFLDRWGDTLWEATLQTFQMVGISLFFSVVIGLPLGVLLVLTRPGKSWSNPLLTRFSI